VVCRGQTRNAYRVRVRKFEGKNYSEDLDLAGGGGGNIKRDLKGIVWEDVEWINLAEDTDKWQSICEHSIELWFP
jgi:hypothetical protein